MPEWSIGPHSKCGERVTVPRVRISVFPPYMREEAARYMSYVQPLLYYYDPLLQPGREALRKDRHGSGLGTDVGRDFNGKAMGLRNRKALEDSGDKCSRK